MISHEINSLINCIQINLQRSKHSTTHLVKIIEEKHIDIVLVQEPYAVKGKVCGFPLRYKVLYDDTCDKPKTAIIITNKLLQVIELKTFAKGYSTFAKIQFRAKAFIFVSAYCSPTSDLSDQLAHMQDFLVKVKPQNCIIGMDSNAKSKIWFRNSEDNRGQLLEDFISQNDLLVLNNNEDIPTFHTFRGDVIAESYIDITIANVNSSALITHWQVLKEDSLSDHRYIFFTINDTISKIEHRSTIKFNTKSANWETFADLWKPHIQHHIQLIENITNTSQLNAYVNTFDLLLTQICFKSMSKVSHNNKHPNSNNWWTQELSECRLKVNNARRRHQRCQRENRPELKNAYLSLKNVYIKLINKQKINSWNNFVEESTRDNAWGLVYKIARNQLNQEKVNELIAQDGRLITDSKEIAQAFMQKLFPTDNPVLDLQKHKDIRAQVNQTYQQPIDSPFTSDEITSVVFQQNPKKSPGEDGFTADIIQNLHSIDTSFLYKLYNKCLELCEFPEKWKTRVIKVI